jgi:hypothetical protein
VYALAALGSDLYAGGVFNSVDGIPATNIAKWNGSSWSALGAGVTRDGDVRSYVYALAVSGSNLYVGGGFTTAGGIAANNIAKWDGSGWSPLSSGISGDVFALAVSGSDLYAGGNITMAGGIQVFNLAKWDGSSWSAFGGMDQGVKALAVSGSDLYVGGLFTNPKYIAKWDGRTWSALGSGLGGGVNFSYVSALAVSGGDLYVGGNFTTAGGIAATNMAKWNGSDWSPMGAGMAFLNLQIDPNHYPQGVFALAVSGTDLYAGGLFTMAGGKVSTYIARAYLPSLPALSLLRSGTDVMISWPSVDTAGFSLEQAGAIAAPATWVTTTASITDDGTNKSVTVPATNSAQFFRLRGP